MKNGVCGFPWRWEKRRASAAAAFPLVAFLLLLLAGMPVQGLEAPYDPLRVPAGAAPERLELTADDSPRGRTLPVRVYLPKSKTPAPVVLFSHGLGGNRAGSEYLGIHWAARGYAAVFLQHPGSDDQVWKGRSPLERRGALRQAASPRNLQLRIGDVSAVLDQLQRWNAAAGHPLLHRLDLTHVGMSGHSFGAVTTQAVSG